jgi:hypothetical protein
MRPKMPLPVEGIFWQPFRHVCGCYMEWGGEVPHADLEHTKAAQRSMFAFLESIKGYPCPMHGSASGDPAPPLAEGEQRIIRASNVYYKMCAPDRHVFADRLSSRLGVVTA